MKDPILKAAHSKFDIEKHNLSNIKFGIDAEIGKVLSLFCEDEPSFIQDIFVKVFSFVIYNYFGVTIEKP